MKYIETNALQWDKRTRIHKDSEFYDLKGFISGKNMLKAIELAEVGDVNEKSLLHCPTDPHRAVDAPGRSSVDSDPAFRP